MLGALLVPGGRVTDLPEVAFALLGAGLGAASVASTGAGTALGLAVPTLLGLAACSVRPWVLRSRAQPLSRPAGNVHP